MPLRTSSRAWPLRGPPQDGERMSHTHTHTHTLHVHGGGCMWAPQRGRAAALQRGAGRECDTAQSHCSICAGRQQATRRRCSRQLRQRAPLVVVGACLQHAVCHAPAALAPCTSGTDTSSPRASAARQRRSAADVEAAALMIGEGFFCRDRSALRSTQTPPLHPCRCRPAFAVALWEKAVCHGGADGRRVRRRQPADAAGQVPDRRRQPRPRARAHATANVRPSPRRRAALPAAAARRRSGSGSSCSGRRPTHASRPAPAAAA